MVIVVSPTILKYAIQCMCNNSIINLTKSRNMYNKTHCAYNGVLAINYPLPRVIAKYVLRGSN